MNRISFVLAAILLFGLTVFNYYNYPKVWREKLWFRLLLKLFHLVGMSSLAIVFTLYSELRYDWLKWIISRWASLYFIMTMLIFFGFLVRLAVVGVCRLVRRLRKTAPAALSARRIADKRVHTVCFCAAAFLVATIGFFNIGWLHTTSYDVHVRKKSVNTRFKIALIADVHAGAGTWRMTYDDLTRRLQETECDVLLLAGDIFDETTAKEDIAYLAASLGQIQPKYGKYFVYGNHDDYHEDWAADEVAQMGVTVLKDEAVTLAGDIQLVGRLDPIDKRLELDALFDTLRVDREKPVIMLTHRPKEFQRMSEEGCDLAVAGHTHGYNIHDAPLIMALNDMVYGRREYGDMTAVVTSGVSNWGFHYKFPACSEVVEITLTFE